MVNLTIDGKQIEVPEGTTVLRAAEKAGITIPTLCDHPSLTPYGGCRLCVVEVAGARTLQTACTLPVTNGMVVNTDTEKTREARKFVLTLIFSERNHFCMYCQVSGGDCELQNSAYREGMTHWPLQPNWQPYAVDASHPDFVLDNNRCILCRRCVRACGEMVGNYTLGFEERGANSFLVADLGTPLGESSCISCGVCVQICPTGALIDRESAYRGKEVQVEHNLSVCNGCSVGCSMDVLTRDNHLVRIEGDWDAAVNGGLLCEKGRFAPMKEERERVLTPMVRKNGSLKAATWEEAISVAASQIKPLVGKNGDGVAALASTRLTAETLATFKKFFKDGLHASIVTTLEDELPASFSTVAQETGKPFEGKLDDLRSADCFLTLGEDLVKDHQVAGFFVKRNVRAGAGFILVDGSENSLDTLANLFLKVKDAQVAEALYGIASAAVRLGIAKAAPGGALAQSTVLSNEQAEEAARMMCAAVSPAIVVGKRASAQTIQAALELAKVTGAKVVVTKGDANSFAAAQYGLDKAFKPANHQAIYVALGDDTAVDSLVEHIKDVPFLAVQASYISPLTAVADVVFPVEMWAEQEGHFVNMDGRIQAAKKAVPAPENVLSNQKVLEALAAEMGVALTPADWKQMLSERTPSAELVEG
jgi:formate dehydrogenase major subunit